MDVFDFAGDLVWRTDLSAELTSDFSVNKALFVRSLNEWVTDSFRRHVVDGPIQTMLTFHNKYSPLLQSVGVLGLFIKARSYDTQVRT